MVCNCGSSLRHLHDEWFFVNVPYFERQVSRPTIPLFTSLALSFLLCFTSCSFFIISLSSSNPLRAFSASFSSSTEASFRILPISSALISSHSLLPGFLLSLVILPAELVFVSLIFCEKVCESLNEGLFRLFSSVSTKDKKVYIKMIITFSL